MLVRGRLEFLKRTLTSVEVSEHRA